MECFLPGAGSTGFWAVLEPVFGAGAFDAGGHQLEQWLDVRTPEAMSFFLAWMRCQAEVRDTDVRGPLDEESGCSTRSPCSVPLEPQLQRHLVLRLLSAFDLLKDAHVRPCPIGTQRLGYVLEVTHRRDDAIERGVVVFFFFFSMARAAPC